MDKLIIKALPIPGPPIVKDLVCGCYQVIKEIYNRFEKVKGNLLFKKYIEEKIEELQKAVKQLETSGLVEFPRFCEELLQKVRESLLKCWQKCEELHSKGVLRRMISVYAHERDLQDMEKQLEIANDRLRRIIALIHMEHTKNVQKTVDKGFAQTTTTVIEGNKQILRALNHPEVGVYRGESADGQSPSAISTPDLSEDRKSKLMIIKWYDNDNLTKKIVRYDIEYEDGMPLIFGTPKDLSINGSDTKFAMKLGDPKVVEKRTYTIKVRAVNSHGHGPWSASTIRYLSDRPSKPKIPDIKVISPTQVAVEIQLLKENETNGSEVHSCAVEYMQEKKPVWERCIYNLKHKFVEKVAMTIESLEPNTRYNFRVIMINEVGESQPSDECQTLTHQLIPGIPQDLRISSKRTGNMLKIRWKAPSENPQAVECYHVQIRKAKSKPDSWSTINTPEDAINKPLSVKATNLKSNTKYFFRVRAFNNRGESGDFTDIVEGETRVGKAARIAAATGAFVGGTVGGPLLGGAGAGTAAGVLTDDKTDNTSAAVAAGISAGIGGAILGTIGAPIIGGLTAASVYAELKGSFDVDSPQTSDDEETKLLWKLIHVANENSDSNT